MARVSKYPGFGRRLGGGVTAGQLGRAAAKAVAAGIKGYRAYSKLASGSRSSGAAQVATTHQYDSRVVYRKKRMPRRRRRRWVKALRRNVALQMPQQPTFNYTFNDGNNMLMNGLFTGQGFLAPLLYSYNGSLSGNRDVRRMAQALGPIGDVSTQFRKFVCNSGVFDLTGTYTNTNPSVTLELDMYVIDCSKLTGNVFDSPTEEFSDIQTDLDGAGALNLRGVTPFQLSVGSQGHRMRIVSKRRWQLSSGLSITYQYRDSRNRVFGTNELENSAATHSAVSYRNRGTVMFLFIGKLIGDPQAEDLAGFRIGYTRNYSLKIMPATTQQSSSQVVAS